MIKTTVVDMLVANIIMGRVTGGFVPSLEAPQ